MICSFLYKLEGIVSKLTTGAPPPGVSTLEGQNWKLQFPGMKLEGGMVSFGKPSL